jgi:hypothetical protein
MPGDGMYSIEQGADGRQPRTFATKSQAEVKVHICVVCHTHLNETSEFWASNELVDLIRAGRGRRFEEDDLRRLAHWCVRTAIILDLAYGDDAMYTPAARRELAVGLTPQRTFVWAGRYGGDPHGSFIKQFAGQEARPTAPQLGAVLTTAHLGCFAFQVLTLTGGPARQVGGASRYLFPIWPRMHVPTSWDPEAIQPLSEEEFRSAHEDIFARARLPVRQVSAKA